jgi:hypothetical protein
MFRRAAKFQRATLLGFEQHNPWCGRHTNWDVVNERR